MTLFSLIVSSDKAGEGETERKGEGQKEGKGQKEHLDRMEGIRRRRVTAKVSTEVTGLFFIKSNERGEGDRCYGKSEIGSGVCVCVCV